MEPGQTLTIYFEEFNQNAEVNIYFVQIDNLNRIEVRVRPEEDSLDRVLEIYLGLTHLDGNN